MCKFLNQILPTEIELRVNFPHRDSCSVDLEHSEAELVAGTVMDFSTSGNWMMPGTPFQRHYLRCKKCGVQKDYRLTK